MRKGFCCFFQRPFSTLPFRSTHRDVRLVSSPPLSQPRQRGLRSYSTPPSSLPGQHRETIFALSSAKGKAGVAVIRVSGPSSRAALSRLCPQLDLDRARDPAAGERERDAAKKGKKKRELVPRYLQLASLSDPFDGNAPLDEAMVCFFKGPSSFTGEDVVELHVHGAPAVVSGTLGALGKMKELRPAEAGEFTLRAFENGKLDLAEIEGLSDLLASNTSRQRAAALSQLRGSVSKTCFTLREEILRCLAHVEAVFDFGEDEGIEDEIFDDVRRRISTTMTTIEKHLEGARAGEIIRDGLNAVIVGKPNAGKSSLLNRLVGRSVSIVTSIPGTTRDVIETAIEVNGVHVVLSDTAGLRQTDDEVEAVGVKLAAERAKRANLLLEVVDSTVMARTSSRLASSSFLHHVHSGSMPATTTSTCPDEVEGRGKHTYAHTHVHAHADGGSMERGEDSRGGGSERNHRSSALASMNIVDKGSGDIGDAMLAGADASECEHDSSGKMGENGKEGDREGWGESEEKGRDVHHLFVLNKVDELSEKERARVEEKWGEHENEMKKRGRSILPPIFISAKHGEGMDELISVIENAVDHIVGKVDEESVIITRERQKYILEECYELLHSAYNSFHTPELACEDLRYASYTIGQLTGHASTEEMLGVIFSEFCIGK